MEREGLSFSGQRRASESWSALKVAAGAPLCSSED